MAKVLLFCNPKNFIACLTAFCQIFSLVNYKNMCNYKSKCTYINKNMMHAVLKLADAATVIGYFILEKKKKKRYFLDLLQMDDTEQHAYYIPGQLHGQIGK